MVSPAILFPFTVTRPPPAPIEPQSVFGCPPLFVEDQLLSIDQASLSSVRARLCPICDGAMSGTLAFDAVTRFAVRPSNTRGAFCRKGSPRRGRPVRSARDLRRFGPPAFDRKCDGGMCQHKCISGQRVPPGGRGRRQAPVDDERKRGTVERGPGEGGGRVRDGPEGRSAVDHSGWGIERIGGESRDLEE